MSTNKSNDMLGEVRSGRDPAILHPLVLRRRHYICRLLGHHFTQLKTAINYEHHILVCDRCCSTVYVEKYLTYGER